MSKGAVKGLRGCTLHDIQRLGNKGLMAGGSGTHVTVDGKHNGRSWPKGEARRVRGMKEEGQLPK